MNIQDAIRLLRIDKHRLDDELEQHADLSARVGQQLAKANSKSQEAKNELERTEARLYLTFREAGTKTTAAEIDAQISRSAVRVQAWGSYQTAREEYEEWLGVAEAWRQRSYTITKLADLFAANYFSLTLSSTTAPRDERPAWQKDAHALPARRAAEIAAPQIPTHRLIIKRK